MICTVAMIVATLGYMPPPGTVIIVPASRIEQYSERKLRVARACAKRYGILWQIDQSR